ncbi:hypothetical protein Gohar_011496, partial [Gossypium harknessii]|nr:hypothetical protein [Gossypium harknessii]
TCACLVRKVRSGSSRENNNDELGFSGSVTGKKRATNNMEKSFTLIHMVATAGVFSAVSCWYGFMFGRESARKELGDLIESLRRDNSSSSSSSPPSHS